MNHKLNKNVAFLTLGCKVNSYETDAMKKLFLEADCEIVDFSQKADIYVVNTCTVTNIADRKSRQMLHKAKKNNENAIVIAVGCYVQAAADILEKDKAIDIVIGNNNKKNIIDIVHNYFNDETENEAILNINNENEYEDLNIESVGEKSRAYIKIQDGCNQFCSYCIIPYARGRVRSRKQEEIFKEIKRIVQKGYKEIVLTGIHLSSYGIDFHQKVKNTEDKLTRNESVSGLDYQTEWQTPIGQVKNDLLDLIVQISKIEGVERIRLGSLEPRIITEEFAKTLSKIEQFCPHFHLSLQSGSDQTLKRMNRRYSTKEYYEKCELLRKYFNNPAITTDVIVGFPGESNEEFSETKAFLEKIAFSKMHIFKYSKRKGTKAETMPDQIDDKEKTNRSNILLEMDKRFSHEYQESFMDKIQKVLIEETTMINGITYQIGHNERYLKLAVLSDKDYTNQVINVKVMRKLNDEILFCEIID